MRFQLLDIIPYRTDPVTGQQVPPHIRLEQTIAAARRAEELGFDAVAVGERHAGPFLSSSPTVLLGALAAATTRIRLGSGVTVLPLLDPVRVAEDYATIDQLSAGRLELTIGKGNEVAQYPLLGYRIDDQWELLAAKYDVLHKLWTETEVDWAGNAYTRPLAGVTALPRPFAGPPRIWHGSATTLFSAGLAASKGDPLFSANAIQPLNNYGVLVDHYRSEYARHGHDPALAYVGAGSGPLFIADTTQEAIDQFGPVYEGIVAATNVPGNNTPYRDIRHAVAEGPSLVGTPEQIIDKIGSFHDRLGHDIQSISLPTTLPFEQQLDILQRFAEEVIPVVRRQFPTTLWTDADPYGRRPAFAGGVAFDGATPKGAPAHP